jgi:protein SCO1/2
MAPLAGALLRQGAAAAEVPAAATSPSVPASPFPPPSPSAPSPRERLRQRYLPNVALRTQDNRPVRFYDDLIKDKIVTINFFFAKCEEICPVVIANLARVQKLLGDRVGRDIFMVSVTLKPEQDTPEALTRFAAMHGAGPGWTFLTGERSDIELLRRSLGFTNPDVALDKDVNQHIGNVRYGNEPLMLWAACPGLARPEWIAESISWMIRPEVAAGAVKS